MPHYRKKPVVIEAFQMTEERRRVPGTWPQWLLRAWQQTSRENGFWHDAGHMVIGTLEGEMRVSHDDWIIKGVCGELYPCAPGAFEITYDLVEEPAATG